jgi:Holliday junction resolvasome RuvABC ATP-dependent DNA helicase subunit
VHLFLVFVFGSLVPFFTRFSGQPNNEVIEDLDESGRPKQKVALLHGAPGLGKTTLAHVVAKHAGYNVVEMNASDDRSIEGRLFR